jgi:SpoVK/Ycf46/Vps4 family AAA+-type ATPase
VENFCVSQACIDLIIWGIDGVPLNCFKKLRNEWMRKKRNSKLIFVCQTLMSLDTGFVGLFEDPKMLVGVAVSDTETAANDTKSIVDFPQIDVSKIPMSAIEMAKTNFIIPMTQPELIAPFASIISMAPRVLIHGPSKSGKSTLAKWMIREVLMKKFPAINVIEMHASQLFSKYLGGSEKRIQKLFRKAAASAPSVIVVEGIHTICPARGRHDDDEEEGGGVGQTYTRILATFLMSLDGIDSLGSEHNKVAFIGTSLLGPDKLDPAAVRPGRLEVHIALDD